MDIDECTRHIQNLWRDVANATHMYGWGKQTMMVIADFQLESDGFALIGNCTVLAWGNAVNATL
ncbi:MAG: hypothetical protein JXQ99_04660 [Hyphomicrobiaceae bacterium]